MSPGGRGPAGLLGRCQPQRGLRGSDGAHPDQDEGRKGISAGVGVSTLPLIGRCPSRGSCPDVDSNFSRSFRCLLLPFDLESPLSRGVEKEEKLLTEAWKG